MLLKDILSESKNTHTDGDKFFNSEGWNIANGMTSGNARSIIIHMYPKDFLKMAMTMPRSAIEDFNSRAGEIKTLMSNGVQMSSLPQLSFEHNGKGVAKVVDHDGRHRALALSILGIKGMPVVFTSRGSRDGQEIRWSAQRYPGTYDYFKQVWPIVLKGETSGEMEFPVEDPRT